MKMADVVTQRQTWDCVYCCFSMWSGLTYETVMEVALSIGLGKKGVDDYQMIELGKCFGMNLFHLPLFNEGLTGIITVPSKNKINGYHSVFYKNLKLYDPQFCLFDKHWYFPNVGDEVFKQCITVDLCDPYSLDFVQLYMSQQNKILDDHTASL